MGIALYRLAGYLERSDFNDLDQLAVRIEQRQLSAEFMREWDKFLATFGWRGPLEMDLASPRYADAPQHALRQMTLLAIADKVFGPVIGRASGRESVWRYVSVWVVGGAVNEQHKQIQIVNLQHIQQINTIHIYT